MKNILMIGESSYIGKNFMEYVNANEKKEIQVTGISGRNNRWKNEVLSKYHSVIILSAIVHKNEKKIRLNEYDDINFKLAVDITKACKEAKVKQVLFMSTAAVYGQVETVGYDTLPKPNTLYGISKYKAELEMMKLQSDDFFLLIFRPPMVYGDGCNGNYKRLCTLSRFTPFLPRVENQRSVIHINRLVEKMYYCIMDDSKGIFHPQDQLYRNTTEWICSLRKSQNKKTILIRGMDGLIKFFCRYSLTLNKLFGTWVYEKDLL